MLKAKKTKYRRHYRERKIVALKNSTEQKPPPYIRIKSNKPIGKVKIVELSISNTPDCKCDPNSERPCGAESDCLNRMSMFECNPHVCSAGEHCLNQVIQNRLYSPVTPYKTNDRGWGVKTLTNVKKGDFIIEYVGEIIDKEEYKRRISRMNKNQDDNYYFLAINQNQILDAKLKGNISRFMNHSCDPNCEAQKWTVNGNSRIGIFAAKDIPVNAELVFDYNLAIFGNKLKPCLCGSKTCSGFIGRIKAINKVNNYSKAKDDAKFETVATKKSKKITNNLSLENISKKPQLVHPEDETLENKDAETADFGKMKETIKDSKINIRFAQIGHPFVAQSFCICIEKHSFNNLVATVTKLDTAHSHFFISYKNSNEQNVEIECVVDQSDNLVSTRGMTFG